MVYTNAMDTTAATTELVEWGNVCKAFGYVTRPGVSIGGNAGGVALGVLAKVSMGTLALNINSHTTLPS